MERIVSLFMLSLFVIACGSETGNDNEGDRGEMGKNSEGGIERSSTEESGNSTVTDEATGLMWMKCPAGQSGRKCDEGSFSEHGLKGAIEYCDTLDLAGHDDWRLPERHELESIVDYNQFDPAIDEATFPGTYSPISFWSSSSRANSTSRRAWYVDFYDGGVNYSIDPDHFAVRCVRGEALGNRVFDNSVISDERVVHDLSSGLIWQGCSAGQSGESCDQGTEEQYVWQDSIDYCDQMTWAGYSDWRLPEIYELSSIVDPAEGLGAIDDTAFPANSTEWFWSSSSDLSGTDLAWGVRFYYGNVFSNDKADMGAVRCVRGVMSYAQ